MKNNLSIVVRAIVRRNYYKYIQLYIFLFPLYFTKMINYLLFIQNSHLRKINNKKKKK